MKIQLRRLKKSDNIQLSKIANNKNIWNFIKDFFPNPYTISDADFFIELTQKENPKVTFAVTYNNQLCGIIGLIQQTDVYQKNAELGYWIAEEYWGEGIATKSIALIIDYGFGKLNFERIYSGVFSNNISSMKVLKSNRFKEEGIFKNAIFKNEKLLDEHRFSILKDDYFRYYF